MERLQIIQTCMQNWNEILESFEKLDIFLKKKTINRFCKAFV